MKQDWATQLVDRCVDPRYDMVPPRLVVKLLRAERAWMVRLVTRLRAKARLRTYYQRHYMTEGKVVSAYTLACDDLLAALKGRR